MAKAKSEPRKTPYVHVSRLHCMLMQRCFYRDPEHLPTPASGMLPYNSPSHPHIAVVWQASPEVGLHNAASVSTRQPWKSLHRLNSAFLMEVVASTRTWSPPPSPERFSSEDGNRLLSWIGNALTQAKEKFVCTFKHGKSVQKESKLAKN